MALNTFKCNYVTPLRFKGLNIYISYRKLCGINFCCSLWHAKQKTL